MTPHSDEADHEARDEAHDDGLPRSVSARVRAAALEELRRAPAAAPWRRRAARALAALLAFSGLALAVVVAAGIGAGSRVLSRAPLLLSLGAAQVAAIWAVAAPFSRRRLAASLAVSAAALLVVAVARAAGAHPAVPGQAPDWVCSVSHLAVDLVPLFLAGAVLRDGAWHPLRALAAGLAGGAAGLVVGEVGCERGVVHLLVFHAGAWLLAAAVLALVTRKLRPRSFAP